VLLLAQLPSSIEMTLVLRALITLSAVLAVVLASPSVTGADRLAIEAVANQIAESAGGNPKDYFAYAASLVETLEKFDPSKLRDAMGDENYVKIADAIASVSDSASIPTVNPAYEAAMTAYDAANQIFELAQERLDAAEAAVQAVIADEAGLKTDDIPGNYIEALIGVLFEQRKADVALELADAAWSAAQSDLDALSDDSTPDAD
jgi:hypothetical protein